MKLQRLQKSLVKKSLIFFIILLVVGIGYYFVFSSSQSLSEDIFTVKSKITAAQSDVTKLEKQLESAKAAITYYQNFSTSSHGNAQNFRRDFAKNILSSIRDRDAIYDLKLNMEPFSKASAEYEREKAALYVSKVTVQFTAGTDIDAFNMIKDIALSFPGNVDIKSYTVQRTGELTDATLIGISEGKTDGPIKGEVVFEWQSIQDNRDPSPAAKAASGSSMSPTPPRQGNMPSEPTATPATPAAPATPGGEQ